MSTYVTHFSQVEGAAMDLAREWPGAPPVTVVDCPQDLPVKAPPDARGLFARDGVYMVASNQDPIGVRRTMAHEVIGHHGFRQMLGPAWPSFMVDVLAGARQGDDLLSCARQLVQDIYVDGRGECDLPPLLQADEIVAAVVERKFHLGTGRIKASRPARKLMAATAGRITREWLCMDRPVSSDELEGHILACEHQIRTGGRRPWLVSSLLGCYAGEMKQKPMGPSRPAEDWDESKRMLASAQHDANWWSDWWDELKSNLKLVYFLFLVGIVFWGVYSIIRDIRQLFG